jgi:hypothetical protein
MSQASFYRIGAVAMIVGTVFALVFNVVHGRASDATNTEAQLRCPSWPRSGSLPWACSSGDEPRSFRPDTEGDGNVAPGA